MKFLIKTRCTFENVFHVEAETLEAATKKVEGGFITNFMQRCISDEIVSSTESLASDGEFLEALRQLGYF